MTDRSWLGNRTLAEQVEDTLKGGATFIQLREKELDFEQVRGDFESNPFVMAVLKHIEVKTALGDELIGRMQRVSEN